MKDAGVASARGAENHGLEFLRWGFESSRLRQLVFEVSPLKTRVFHHPEPTEKFSALKPR